MNKKNNDEKILDYIGIGRKLYLRGYYREALEPLKKAIKVNDKSVWLYTTLGDVYCKLGYNETALGYYLNGLDINPEDSNLLFKLGNFYHDLELYTNSIDCFKKVKKLDPEHPWVDLSMADTYYCLNYEKKAKEHYFKAGKWLKLLIKGNIDDEDIFNLGHVYERLSELLDNPKILEKAKETFLLFLEKCPEDQYAIYRLGNIYCELKDKDSAHDCRKKLEKMNKDLSDDLDEYIAICFN
jgi:hypothetical protein